MHFLILIVDGIDQTQRDQIQAVVEASADDWWHQTPDNWIVRTDQSASDWRDKFGAILHNKGSGILALYLEPKRGWAVRAVGGTQRFGTDWLKNEYKPSSPA